MEKLDIDHMWGVNRLDFHHTLVSGVPWVRGGVQALFPEQQLVIQLRSWRGYNIPVSLVQNNYLWEYWNSAQDEMSDILLICERYHFILKNNFVSMQHPLYIIFFFYIWFNRKTNMAQMFVGKEENMKLLLWIVLCSRRKLSCELYFDWILS